MLKLIGVIIFVMAIGCVASFGLRRVMYWILGIDEIIALLKEIRDEI